MTKFNPFDPLNMYIAYILIVFVVVGVLLS